MPESQTRLCKIQSSQTCQRLNQRLENFLGIEKSPPTLAQLFHRVDIKLTKVSWHPVSDDASNPKKPYGVLPIEHFLTYANGLSRKGKLDEGTTSASSHHTNHLPHIIDPYRIRRTVSVPEPQGVTRSSSTSRKRRFADCEASDPRRQSYVKIFKQVLQSR